MHLAAVRFTRVPPQSGHLQEYTGGMIGQQAHGCCPDPRSPRMYAPLPARRAAALTVAVLTAAGLLMAGCTNGPGVGETDHGAAETEPAAGFAGPGTEGSGPLGEARPSSSAADSIPEPAVTAGAGPDCPGVRCATVAMSGDLLLHEALWEQAAQDAVQTGKGKLDFGRVLGAQEQYLESADLAICQLETPLADAAGPYSGYPAFNAPPQILDAVSAVGYDACTTASNHSIDHGTAGLERTLAALDARGLEHTGSYRSPAAARQVLIVDTPAARVAVITGTFSLNGLEPESAWQVDLLDPQAMIAKAKQARAEGADIVLGAIHAGDEYTDYANPQQQETAHLLADSGQFSLVYGHHSHSVQPIERYHNTWIAYGLGNTIAAHATDNIVNTEGLMVRAQFSQAVEGGSWDVARLDWLPATFDGPQHRWCPVAADRLDAAAETGRWCISEQADTASRGRTKSTVGSVAGTGGIVREWLLSED
jgi:hypothetical protein